MICYEEASSECAGHDVPPGSFAAIAFNVDRVVAVGPDPEAVRAEARAKGEKRPILYLVPDPEELRMPRV